MDSPDPPAPTPDAPRRPLQLRIEKLARFHATLAGLLSEAGLSAERFHAVFSRDLKIECLECHVEISGDEFSRVALATSELPDAALERLRKGYCARKDCRSYYYVARLDANPEVAWHLVQERMDAPPRLAEETPPPRRRLLPVDPGRRRQIRRVGAGLALIFVLLLVRNRINSGSIFLRKAPSKYSIDPASLHPVPPANPAQPAKKQPSKYTVDPASTPPPRGPGR